MKVLWFSVTSSLYTEHSNSHNGGGWISSLEKLIADSSDIELGVAFEYSKSIFGERRGKTAYYGIDVWKSYKRRLARSFDIKAEEKYVIPECLKIIEDFKPDIIQIFGSESCFALLPEYTSIPIVIHMQGSLPSYYNARYPVGISMLNILFSTKVSLKEKFFKVKGDYIFHQRALREERALGACRNFMGRTHWDKSICHVYSPDANYYNCEEVLRDSFYGNNKQWIMSVSEKIVISTIISGPLYKGVDVILKTARLLKRNNIDFEWRVFGIYGARFIESQYKISASDVNVKYMGVVSADTLSESLMESKFVVHPSYIDNSPNSVCEAQIIGVPVVCANVGGLSSLVEDEVTGFLVPANDPVKMADVILSNYKNEILLTKISKKSMAVASLRHDKKAIAESLLSIYERVAKK